MTEPQKERLEAIAAPVCRAHGVELVDVSFGREPGGAVVRVLIDRPVDAGGQVRSAVSLADCQSVSRDLSTALDVDEDAMPGPYRLEVSSPGVDRPLVKLADFERFTGQEIKLQTKAPIGDRRKFNGKLLGVVREETGETIRLEQDGKPVTIPFNEVTRANLVFRFR
jgi:ribosome maturation factor RimP